MVPLSVLDLAPVPEGSDAGQALRNSRELAHHAERLGFRRFWMAEHHSMAGVASAATAVCLAYVAEGTSRTRARARGTPPPRARRGVWWALWGGGPRPPPRGRGGDQAADLVAARGGRAVGHAGVALPR